MAVNYSPTIVRDGLTFYIDAANPKSFSGGETVTNLFSSDISILNNVVKQNSSFVFDDENQYIELPDTNNVKPNMPLSVGVWMNTNQIGSTQFILSTDDYNCAGWASPRSGSNRYYGVVMLINANGFFTCDVGNGGGCGAGSRRTFTSLVSAQENDWYYFFAVFSAHNICDIFINGELTDQTTSGTGNSLSYSNENGRLGSATNGAQNFYGKLSNVQIYSRSLTPEEIKQNYNALKGRYGL